MRISVEQCVILMGCILNVIIEKIALMVRSFVDDSNQSLLIVIAIFCNFHAIFIETPLKPKSPWWTPSINTLGPVILPM